MLNDKNTNSQSNFWISYADLMAGLLFVFILLIGVIVSKFIILKSDLHEQKIKLDNLSTQLTQKEAKFNKLKIEFMKNQQNLKSNKNIILSKDKTLSKHKKDILEKNKTLTSLQLTIKKLKLKNSLLNNKMIFLQNDINKTNNKINEQQKLLKKYEGEIIVFSNDLSDAREKHKNQDKQISDLLNSIKQTSIVNKKIIQAKNTEILSLLNIATNNQTKYDDLIYQSQKQKSLIKSLTGIKLKVIAQLKETLGNKINIDKKSGSLRLSSNILFDKGHFILKEKAKEELTLVFKQYIKSLITNENIKQNIDKIIIEGHTDTDGEYLYNLDLSQKRAYAVMNFLSTLDFTKEHNIRPLLTASGRAFLDNIKDEYGKEDKMKSRRIEIKFRLKNEDAMLEIEKILDAN